MKPRSSDDWVIVLDAIEWFQQMLRDNTPEQVRQIASTPPTAPTANVAEDEQGIPLSKDAHNPTAPTVAMTPQLREAMLAGAHELDGAAWINEQHKFLTPASQLRAKAALLRSAVEKV